MRMHYAHPARQWEEALPIGNGRIGAMCFGMLGEDRIQINDATFWSGSPARRDRLAKPSGPWSSTTLRSVRQAVINGDAALAGELIKQSQGAHTQAYQPLADLAVRLSVDGAAPSEVPVSDYARVLDLETAIASHRYRIGGRRIVHEAWVSRPAQALVVSIVADTADLEASFELTSPHPHTVRATGTGRLELLTEAPADVPPLRDAVVDPGITYVDALGGGMGAAVALRVETDGRFVTSEHQVHVVGASRLLLVLTTETGYDGADLQPRRTPDQCARSACHRADATLRIGVDRLRVAHLADYSALYQRCIVELDGADAPEQLSVPAALERRSPADLIYLQNLLFAYGRYLLISSSRPGGPPANLQGIWNEHVRPVWSSNYTLNINLEMNYWPAEVTNLAECHLPLLTFIEQLAREGETTARSIYDTPGWTAHHNSDIWCWTAPVGGGRGDPKWSAWPMAAPWLCLHLWDHYAFSRDRRFLRDTAWPVMRAAVEFCLSWTLLLPDGTHGTAPSTSPENEYIDETGSVASVGRSSTMDVSLIRMLLQAFLDAGELLEMNDHLLAWARELLTRLRPLRVGTDGRLLEWDGEYPDADPHHRHQSHLVGLYPGDEISRRRTAHLVAAASRTLDARGQDTTGWSLAWRVALRARLGQGDAAHALLLRFLTPTLETGTRFSSGSGVYPNLFCAHPPFQIDGNFGITAAMAELLVQSDPENIELLPALPPAWRSGTARGLRTRAAMDIAVRWENHALVAVHLRAVASAHAVISWNRHTRAVTLTEGEELQLDRTLEPVG